MLRIKQFTPFCDGVCERLTHATRSERDEVRKELQNHMLDHAEALIAIGYTEAEARAAAVKAMGDPEKIGRELNKEFPYGWLILSRGTFAALILIVPLLLCCFAFYIPSVLTNLSHRNLAVAEDYAIDHDIEGPNGESYHFFMCNPVEIGGHYFAKIAFVAYDRNPFRSPSQVAARHFLFNGTSYPHSFDDEPDRSRPGVYICYASVPISEGDQYVSTIYDYAGCAFTERIPINWEGFKDE